MRFFLAALTVVLLAATPHLSADDDLDGRVRWINMPNEDISVSYVEYFPVFTVGLNAKSTMVRFEDAYIGDGKVALLLEARDTKGVFFQGELVDTNKEGPNFFNKGVTIKVKPGFKRAKDLKPGDLYITLRGVKFEMPKE